MRLPPDAHWHRVPDEDLGRVSVRLDVPRTESRRPVLGKQDQVSGSLLVQDSGAVVITVNLLTLDLGGFLGRMMVSLLRAISADPGGVARDGRKGKGVILLIVTPVTRCNSCAVTDTHREHSQK